MNKACTLEPIVEKVKKRKRHKCYKYFISYTTYAIQIVDSEKLHQQPMWSYCRLIGMEEFRKNLSASPFCDCFLYCVCFVSWSKIRNFRFFYGVSLFLLLVTLPLQLLNGFHCTYNEVPNSLTLLRHSHTAFMSFDITLWFTSLARTFVFALPGIWPYL